MRNYESEAAALRGLKPSSKVLALVLAARMNDRHDDWPGRPVCFPSLDTLEQDSDLKERMVRYALDELVEAKVIRVYKDRKPGARWSHSVYEWTAPISPNYHPDWMKRPDTQNEAVGARLTDEGWEYCRTHHIGPNLAAEQHPELVLPAEKPDLIDDATHTAPTSVEDDCLLPIEIEAPTPAPVPTAVEKPSKNPPGGFEEWWSQYPKKVKKLDAIKAYKAALKQGVTPGKLLDGLQRQKAAWKAKGTESQYIPYPATWLRAGSWEDELDPPATSTDSPAPTINPNTGKPVTRDDFGYACIAAGIDPNLYINYWKPYMGLPTDPAWPEWAAKIDRFCGRA